MIVGLFFTFLAAALIASMRLFLMAEGSKIGAALAGQSRHEPVIVERPVTVRWQRENVASVSRPQPLAAAA